MQIICKLGTFYAFETVVFSKPSFFVRDILLVTDTCVTVSQL